MNLHNMTIHGEDKGSNRVAYMVMGWYSYFGMARIISSAGPRNETQLGRTATYLPNKDGMG